MGATSSRTGVLAASVHRSTPKPPATSGDLYGSLIEGHLTAPETGSYTFWLSSDDEGQFFMTTDPADPLNPSKTNLICWVPGYSGLGEWTKFPQQKSVPVNLEAGKIYYLQILHKEGTGGDYVQLGWQTPSGALERPMPAWHFQPLPYANTFVIEPDAEVVLGPVAPPRAGGDFNVYDGNWVVIYANINLALPVSYQWIKDGIDVPGANQAYLKFRANMSDNNSAWSVRVTHGGGATTAGPTYLYVVQDKPAVVSAAPVPLNPTAIQVVFIEDVNPLSATNTANYTIPGATVQSASISSDYRTVTLKTTLLTPTQVYSLSIANVQDMATPANTMDPASTTFVIADGAINFRVYSPTFATDRASLRTATTNSATANATYTNNMFLTDELITTTSHPWSLVPLRNDYVGQIIGYVTPPTNGQYKFAIASDDHSILYLGTTDQRSSKREICNYDGSTGQWNLGAQLANQQSALITLVGGQRYYIEAVYRDGTGGEGVTVCWQTPIHVANGQTMPTTNESVQANTQPFLIPAQYLSPFTTFGNIFFKTNLPTTLNAAAGTSPVLRVAADGSMPYYYQWYKGSSPITGATNASYTVPFLQVADNGTTFSVVASNNFSGATSQTTTLAVSADTAKPTVASVGSLYKQVVNVRFSEPVSPASATTLANYQTIQLRKCGRRSDLGRGGSPGSHRSQSADRHHGGSRLDAVGGAERR